MKKWDFILICCALLLGGLLLILLPGKSGDAVSVWEDGVLVMSLPLSEDCRISLSHNEFEIKGHTVRMISADCKDALCLKEGTAERDGQSIICLPNKVVLQVVSSKKSTVDTIAS